MMKIELENRLISFSVGIMYLTDKIAKSSYSSHLSDQLIRSGISAALNYGEAQGAETRKDFIHKIGIVIKELRESLINLKMIRESCICPDPIGLEKMIQENNELIAIFFATLKTARRGLPQRERR